MSGNLMLNSLTVKSNLAADLPQDQRISDEDILNNVNTFLFAGSDTSSLALTWTLLLLAENPIFQDRLRSELFSVQPVSPASVLTEDEIQSLYASIADLPFLDNVIRESIRLIPPVHSSIRVATQDDELPTSYPVYKRNRTASNRTSIFIPKGTFVHVAIEGFNLDKSFWGENAWEFQCVVFVFVLPASPEVIFRPDRWSDLPDTAASLPGLFSNTLTFSAGPRVSFIIVLCPPQE
jgi:cytochrome P450